MRQGNLSRKNAQQRKCSAEKMLGVVQGGKISEHIIRMMGVDRKHQTSFRNKIPYYSRKQSISLCLISVSQMLGRAIAQAVSRRLPTAAARVQTRVWSCGILWWTNVALVAGFLRTLWFPLPIYIPSASPQSSSLSPEAGTIGQEWPQCQ
jgi:hypothetical protein